MQYRILGKTGLKVSEVGLGCWAFGGPFTINGIQAGFAGQDDKESIRVIHTAQDKGINFLDTADAYGLGHSEEVIGQALAQDSRRSRWFIATKAGHLPYDQSRFKSAWEKENLRFCLESSLKRLKTDHVDLYQWHDAPGTEWRETAYESFQKFKKEGKIRWFGLSFYGIKEAQGLLQAGWEWDTAQIEYNMLWTYAKASGSLALAKEKNWGVIVKSPLHGSILTGKYGEGATFPKDDLRADIKGVAKHFSDPARYKRNLEFLKQIEFLKKQGRSLGQAALRYVLDEPVVSTIIVGSRKVNQLLENIGVSELAGLTPEEMARLRDVQKAFNTDAE